MNQIVRDIKAELRASMNGVAAQAMRQAGMNADYRLNFGVELPRIKAIAEEISMEYLDNDTQGEKAGQLANELWKEQVRECRIMATIIYPNQRMDEQMAQTWVEQIRGVEIAQIAAMNIFSKVRNASQLALRWMADDMEIRQITGFYTMLHLVRNNQLNQRALDEVVDHARTAAKSESPQLVNVASKLLAELDDGCNKEEKE